MVEGPVKPVAEMHLMDTLSNIILRSMYNVNSIIWIFTSYCLPLGFVVAIECSAHRSIIAFFILFYNVNMSRFAVVR